MWDYSATVMDHFLNPRNVGDIPDADAVVEVKTSGGSLRLGLRLSAQSGRIVEARFQAFGCPGAIASASATTELVKGRTPAEAALLAPEDIAAYLGELPEEKFHSAVLAIEALRRALELLP